MANEFYNAVRSLSNGFANMQAADVEFAMSKQSRELAALSGEDVKLFAEEMQKYVNQMHPSVADIFVRNAQTLLDGVRAANTQTKSGYKGSTGSGNALYFTVSWPYDFVDPALVGTTYRRTWVRPIAAISAVGTPTPFITGTVVAVGTPANLQTAEEETLVFLGFTESTSVVPIASAVQFVYNNDTYNYWNIPWELMKIDGGAFEQQLVYELPQPVTIPPEQNIQVNVRYDGIGNSWLTPIVVRYRRSTDMRTL